MPQVVRAYRIVRAAQVFQETAPTYGPYPKPTQVDW